MTLNRRIQTGLGLLGVCWACTAALAGKEFREELHQTHPLSDAGQVSVENVNGSIRVIAWDRPEVQVDVVKTANSQKRMDETETKIDARATVIRVRTKCISKSSIWNFFRGNNPANVEYTLKVPRLAALNSLATVNGSLIVAFVQAVLAGGMYLALGVPAAMVWGSATFIVAHADLIVVLEHGCVQERGSHRSLMDAGGLYRSAAAGWATAGDAVVNTARQQADGRRRRARRIDQKPFLDTSHDTDLTPLLPSPMSCALRSSSGTF